MRVRLVRAVNKDSKIGSAIRDLGCSIEEFKIYIEKQFRDGMSWSNWGSVFELDHIKPLCSFDLTDRAQFLEAAHFTNFQPLLIEEHKRKSAEDKKKSIRRQQRPELIQSPPGHCSGFFSV